MIVVSDTSPICYLLLIGEIDILPQLYSQVLIPKVVQQELTDAKSPAIVQTWSSQPPEWLVIQTVEVFCDRPCGRFPPGASHLRNMGFNS